VRITQSDLHQVPFSLQAGVFAPEKWDMDSALSRTWLFLLQSTQSHRESADACDRGLGQAGGRAGYIGKAEKAG
jgi:hypothetical protein